MKSFDQQVADWARTKPAGEGYDYTDIHNCALCQFLRDTGICDDPSVGGDNWGWYGFPETDVIFSSDLRDALSARPRTFGALADRLSA